MLFKKEIEYTTPWNPFVWKIEFCVVKGMIGYEKILKKKIFKPVGNIGDIK